MKFTIALTAQRVLLLAVALGFLQFLARNGSIPTVIMPAPTEIFAQFKDLVVTHQFRADLTRTALEIAASSALGVAAGLLLGVACAQLPVLGDSLEPYLVSLYSMPTVAFYPLLLAAMGLGSGPIVVLTSGMVAVPVVLNTMVGVREISPVLKKFSRSLGCSRLTRMRKILLPAATPLVFPGIKLGIMYSVIGSVAMEFILSNSGLGYRIGYEYRNFNMLNMWANIVAVIVISCAVVFALGATEKRIRADLA